MKSDAHETLLRALIDRGGRECRIVNATERPWASITFEGARHVVELTLPAALADAFVLGIEEAEFDLRRHLLADLVIIGRQCAVDGSEQVQLEALTLRNG